MRKIGAILAIAAPLFFYSPSPCVAFSLRLGPIHIGMPFFGHRHQHQHRFAFRPVAHTASLREDSRRTAIGQTPMPSSGFLYPALALPIVFADIFSLPAASPTPWPFSYDAIFETAFVKSRPDRDLSSCRQPNREAVIVEHIERIIKPAGVQLQQLQKLGGALGFASGYLAKACPDEIPPQPVARLQLMEWQVERLAQALDFVRQPLQEFEQSLNDSQRFAASHSVQPTAVHADNGAAVCTTTSSSIDRTVEQISLSVQPTDAQRNAMADVKQAFRSAASELDEHCQMPPPSPAARLEAIEARLDATWRALVTVQVELADFASRLSAEQRARFDATDFAAAQ